MTDLSDKMENVFARKSVQSASQTKNSILVAQLVPELATILLHSESLALINACQVVSVKLVMSETKTEIAFHYQNVHLA